MRTLEPWEINHLLRAGWSQQQIEQFATRDDSTPIEYVTGTAEFAGLQLAVNPSVLIPRLETETLLTLVTKKFPAMSALTFVDVGTGSGALAIALARHFTSSQVYALDISAPALSLAQPNCDTHHVRDQVTLLRSNLLEQLPLLADDWVLVANLPYIPTTDYLHLDASVRTHEPRLALDGGEDGFGLIRTLLDQVIARAHWPQAVFLEVDPSHTLAFVRPYSQFVWERINDQFDRPRFLVGMKLPDQSLLSRGIITHSK